MKKYNKERVLAYRLSVEIAADQLSTVAGGNKMTHIFTFAPGGNIPDIQFDF